MLQSFEIIPLIRLTIKSRFRTSLVSLMSMCIGYGALSCSNDRHDFRSSASDSVDEMTRFEIGGRPRSNSGSKWTFVENSLTKGISGDVWAHVVQGAPCQPGSNQFSVVIMHAAPIVGGFANQYNPCAEKWSQLAQTKNDPAMAQVPGTSELYVLYSETSQVMKLDRMTTTVTMMEPAPDDQHEPSILMAARDSGRFTHNVLGESKVFTSAHLYALDGSSVMRNLPPLNNCVFPQIALTKQGHYAYSCMPATGSGSLPFFVKETSSDGQKRSSPIPISDGHSSTVDATPRDLWMDDGRGQFYKGVVATPPRPGLASHDGSLVALYRFQEETERHWYKGLGISYSLDDGETWVSEEFDGAFGEDILHSAIVKDEASQRFVMVWSKRNRGHQSSHDTYVTSFAWQDIGPDLIKRIKAGTIKLRHAVSWQGIEMPPLPFPVNQYWIGLSSYQNFVAVTYLRSRPNRGGGVVEVALGQLQ